jgi:hypothetical protein
MLMAATETIHYRPIAIYAFDELAITQQAIYVAFRCLTDPRKNQVHKVTYNAGGNDEAVGSLEFCAEHGISVFVVRQIIDETCARFAEEALSAHKSRVILLPYAEDEIGSTDAPPFFDGEDHDHDEDGDDDASAEDA